MNAPRARESRAPAPFNTVKRAPASFAPRSKSMMPSAGPRRVTPGVYREIYSHSLSDESFSQGTTWSLVVSRFFQK
jgi:hypothetical protein